MIILNLKGYVVLHENRRLLAVESIGLLFAYYLSEKYPVCLYVHSKEQFDSYSEEGLLFKENGNWKSKHLSK